MSALSILNPTTAVVTMTSLEISNLVESRHDNVKRAIERCVVSGAIIQPPMEDEQSSDSMGRPRATQVYRLDKRSSIIVVAQLCPEFTARIVDRWQELEAKAAQPQPQQATTIEAPVITEVRLLGVLRAELNLSPSGHLGLVHKTLNAHGYAHIATALPQYAVDAPPSELAQGSSMPTKSLTELLKEYKGSLIKTTPIEVNKLLEKQGFIRQEKRESKSSPTGFKVFWVIDTKGLEYGKNITSPREPRETQPHWYVPKFHELMYFASNTKAYI